MCFFAAAALLQTTMTTPFLYVFSMTKPFLMSLLSVDGHTVVSLPKLPAQRSAHLQQNKCLNVATNVTDLHGHLVDSQRRQHRDSTETAHDVHSSNTCVTQTASIHALIAYMPMAK